MAHYDDVIDAMLSNTIRADVIQARSFGMEEDEAEARAIFVLIKREKNNPQADDAYVLTYRDRDAAFENCRSMNDSSGGRYVFKVRETHFSGPMK
jgi:hypothetical protein